MDLSFAHRGAGEAVVFVHAFPCDHTVWSAQLDGLPQWHCLAPDLRGIGGSARGAEPASMAMYAEDLMRLLDRLGIERPVWCGLSLGGYVLFAVLRRWPGRVRALVLCDTRAAADSADARRGRDELIALARRAGPGAVVDRLLPRLLGTSTRRMAPALVQAVRATALGISLEGMVAALEAMRDRPDSTPLLATIAVPTLVMAGGEDEITPPAGLRSLAARIPGASFVEVAGAGHLAPLEQPGPVNAQLRDFLRRI